MEAGKKFVKRDTLREIETTTQKFWETNKIFEADAQDQNKPKYMVTFPYPYMNGRLHLGHSFSLSKCEFAARYQRLQGKTVLFPFGFHCTGMPIKACADKLTREIELFGKNFEGYKPQAPEEEKKAENAEAEKKEDDGKKPMKKHGKAEAKKGKEKYQFQIMQSMGVPLEEIHKFADPIHWLYYFPPYAMQDLKQFGVHVDWRRSFITTDVNPYYDSFIRWQFNKLRACKDLKIEFRDDRPTMFSPLDGQACMDHDRSTGEGVGVQEYTCIKLKVLLDELEKHPDSVGDRKVGEKLLAEASLKGKNVFMVAATLRPETMYGQTNCYVGVDLDYGVFEVSETEAWICTDRAARNMAYQNLFAQKGKVVKLLDLKGIDLVGVPVSAPLSSYEKVYTLPMENVLANKGTGIVTSVPSDAPDDYITLLDLVKKFAYYNIKKEWVEPFLPPKPIIATPNFGNLAAVKAIEDMKIRSQKDKELLKEAKEKVYKEGFYNGTIIVGEYSGTPVQQAKPLIRSKLIGESKAFPYYEPDGLVISRSGDECVVTYADQWYMNYGEDSWKAQAFECLKQMETYHEETRNNFEKTLDWLTQWACSRSFGLGSRLPWDTQYLIESLSDSTIYMAYYTVAHLLQSNALDGTKSGLLDIKPEQMTDAVWDYILTEQAPFPKDTDIPKENLERMRAEFRYFYPLDLRVSGKDLISNHLTFFIYNHVALFPKEQWPKGVRANGHLLLNGEKMSKSVGNFLTLYDAIKLYGADATRFTLADAGDAIEDANFLETTANAAIIRLYNEKEWMEGVVKAKDSMRTGEPNWLDKVFINEMHKIVDDCKKAYDGMLFREALKVGFYDLQTARNEYRKAVTGSDDETGTCGTEGMHRDTMLKYLEVQALLLLPICPHWSEHVWMNILGHKVSIHKALWPTFPGKVDESIIAGAVYLRGLTSKIRAAEDAAARKKAKKGGAVSKIPEGPQKLTLIVAPTFPEWQDKALECLKQAYDPATKSFNGTETQLLGKSGLLKDKKVMPFVATIKKAIIENGPKAFDRALPFSETDILNSNMDYIIRELGQLKVSSVDIVLTTDEKVDAKKKEASVPGSPSYEIVSAAV